MQQYAIFKGDEAQTFSMGLFAALKLAINMGRAELDAVAISSTPITCEVHFEDGWSIRPVPEDKPVYRIDGFEPSNLTP